jgi:DNA repair protein RadC
MKANPIQIKNWPENDRPREKLNIFGAAALSDSELIAILLRSGTRNSSAVDLAREILQLSENNLVSLGRLTVRELSTIKGLGEVKAITLLAALELGRRRKSAELPKKIKVKGSRDAFDFFQPLLADLPHEEFHILLLNRANCIIGHRKISSGGISGTIVDPKLIFSSALEVMSSSIILCHNHPSGNQKPSESDIQLTKKLKEGGRNLEIAVLDHIIIAGTSFYSFADDGSL